VSHLLDVSILVACGWSTHPQHALANRWLDDLDGFSTCSATQMGFLRVSMSAGFGAGYAEARTSLQAIVDLRKHRLVTDKIAAAHLPTALVSRHDITDAHYVALARAHHLKLATLDDALCAKPWAAGIALNPLARSKR
jgi:predicted nucleic acid-binding protein